MIYRFIEYNEKNQKNHHKFEEIFLMSMILICTYASLSSRLYL